MSDSTTLTVRLSSKTKDQLAVLADRTRRSRSFLAAEAIANYVERELAIVAAIERGLEDVKAGRTIPHEEVMRQARELMKAAQRKT